MLFFISHCRTPKWFFGKKKKYVSNEILCWIWLQSFKKIKDFNFFARWIHLEWADTKKALRNAVDPVNVNVHKLFPGLINSVLLEGDSSLNNLANCAELQTLRLEIKNSAKLKCRLIIHNIPVDYSSKEILERFKQKNIPQAAANDIKVVYLYPPVLQPVEKVKATNFSKKVWTNPKVNFTDMLYFVI